MKITIKQVTWWIVVMLFAIALYFGLFGNMYDIAAMLCIIASMLGLIGMDFARNLKTYKVTDKLSITENVKEILSLKSMKVWRRPKQKTGVGGFAIPFFPFFIMISKLDEVDDREIVIHEMVHSALFIYGAQTAMFWIAINILIWDSTIYGTIAMLVLMLAQEYMAFTITKHIAKNKFGFDSRSFTKKIFFKYSVFYSGWFLSIISMIVLIAVTGSPWIFVVFLPWLFLYSRVMAKFFKWFNKKFS